MTLITAQISKFPVLKAKILLNCLRPVGIPEKRSVGPTRSRTKIFCWAVFQENMKISAIFVQK